MITLISLFVPRWLPCPKRPLKYFRSYGMSNIFEDCVGSLWNHRNEVKQVKYASKCSELKKTYPFVEHTCFIVDSASTHQQLTSPGQQFETNEPRFYYMSNSNNNEAAASTPNSRQICIESLIIDDIILKQLLFVY